MQSRFYSCLESEEKALGRGHHPVPGFYAGSCWETLGEIKWNKMDQIISVTPRRQLLIMIWIYRDSKMAQG